MDFKDINIVDSTIDSFCSLLSSLFGKLSTSDDTFKGLSVYRGYPVVDLFSTPCVTIYDQSLDFTPRPDSILREGPGYVDLMKGRWEFKLHMDIWCETRASRDCYDQEIRKLFFPIGENPLMDSSLIGVFLKLDPNDTPARLLLDYEERRDEKTGDKGVFMVHYVIACEAPALKRITVQNASLFNNEEVI